MEENNTSIWVLVLIIVMALVAYLWGIERNLPFTAEVDEDQYVDRAVKMAASGDLNPAWFGNPGSTVIYPLMFIYRVSNAIVTQTSPFQDDPNLLKRFESSFWQFYLAGRLLSVTYAVLSIPLVYLIGRRIFNSRVGLGGAFLFVLYAPVVYYIKIVRTDSAALFFGLLSLWLCLKVLDRPNVLRQVLAGSAIGLSIASRYFMVALIPILLAVDVTVVWEQRPKSFKEIPWIPLLAGLTAIFLAFVFSSPYFILQFPIAMQDIRNEARATHLGADGLTMFGNMLWYIRSAIPGTITRPQVILTAIGVLIILVKRNPLQLLLLGFVIVFLIGISFSPLHWDRWIIQIIPVLSLFIAYTVDTLIQKIGGQFNLNLITNKTLYSICILLLAILPGRQVVYLDLQDSSPSTRVVAREWMVKNLSAQSRIAQEWYTAPLDDTSFKTSLQFSLAEDQHLKDYHREGFDYLVVSSEIYDRYLMESDRYVDETNFYNTLFTETKLIKVFEPTTTMGGPTIRIYKLIEE